MLRADHERPRCPGCGEPIGAYEPLWRTHPRVGGERTSWLEQAGTQRSPLEVLWHAECAEAKGIDGG